MFIISVGVWFLKHDLFIIIIKLMHGQVFPIFFLQILIYFLSFTFTKKINIGGGMWFLF